MALNAQIEKMVALNIKTKKKNGGSERQNWEEMVALNAEKWEDGSGSERPN